MILLLFLLVFPPPDMVNIDGVGYVLEAEVYVNQQPMTSGKQTICIVRLVQVERRRIDALHIENIYVFQGEDYVKFKPYNFRNEAYYIEAVGRFDTRFSVGSWVNVMVDVAGKQIGKECIKIKEVY